MLITDESMPFKYGIDTYDFMQQVIELFAGEGHGISVATCQTQAGTWIELHCKLSRDLRQRLKQVFYPYEHTTPRERRGRVNREDMYAVISLPGKALARGDVPLGVPSLGELLDLLVERRQQIAACAARSRRTTN